MEIGLFAFYCLLLFQWMYFCENYRLWYEFFAISHNLLSVTYARIKLLRSTKQKRSRNRGKLPHFCFSSLLFFCVLSFVLVKRTPNSLCFSFPLLFAKLYKTNSERWILYHIRVVSKLKLSRTSSTPNFMSDTGLVAIFFV